MYNFADDNSLYVIAKTVAESKNTLKYESEVIINQFKNNEMIVNPEKFQAIILDKQKYDYSNETVKFDNITIETLSSVRLIGVQLDNKLNLSSCCKSSYL